VRHILWLVLLVTFGNLSLPGQNDKSTGPKPDGKIGVLTREGASNRKNGIVFLDLTDPAHPKVLSEYTETVTGVCTVPTSMATTPTSPTTLPARCV
jgi:hypothetical protein